MTVDQSKIYANTATNGGADICNKTFGSITLNDNIEQMVELFKDDNINPIGWVCDYDFEQNIYIPDVDPSAENALLKLDYEIIPPSEPETEPSEPSTEQQTEPSTEEPSTEPGTETPSTEESSEPSSEPSSETPSEPDTTPSTPSDADDGSQSGNNITNTDASTNNSGNNTTDNSSDNSDRSNRTEQNDSSNNSTTNNYYTTQTPAEGQGQQNENSTVVVVPDASNQVTTYSTGVSASSDNTNESDSVGQAAVNNAPDIVIDAKGVDVVFGYSESGGYNISINASEVVADKADEKQSISWFDMVQIVLLGAILICLLYKPKTDKVKKYSLKEE